MVVVAASLVSAGIVATLLVAGKRVPAAVACLPALVGLLAGAWGIAVGAYPAALVAAVEHEPGRAKLDAAMALLQHNGTETGFAFASSVGTSLFLLAVVVVASIGESRRSWRWAVPGVLAWAAVGGVAVRVSMSSGYARWWDAAIIGGALCAGAALLGGLATVAQTGGNDDDRSGDLALTAALLFAIGAVSGARVAGITFVAAGGASWAIAFWTLGLTCIALGRQLRHSSWAMLATPPMFAVWCTASLPTHGRIAIATAAEIRRPLRPPTDVALSHIQGAIRLRDDLAVVLRSDLDLPTIRQRLADEQSRMVAHPSKVHNARTAFLLWVDNSVPFSTVVDALTIAREADFHVAYLGGYGSRQLGAVPMMMSTHDGRPEPADMALVIRDDGYLLQAALRSGEPGYFPSPDSPGHLIPCATDCADGYPDQELLDALKRLGGGSYWLVANPDLSWSQAMHVLELTRSNHKNAFYAHGLGYPPSPTSPDGAPADISLDALGGPNWPAEQQ